MSLPIKGRIREQGLTAQAQTFSVSFRPVRVTITDLQLLAGPS